MKHFFQKGERERERDRGFCYRIGVRVREIRSRENIDRRWILGLGGFWFFVIRLRAYGRWMGPKFSYILSLSFVPSRIPCSLSGSIYYLV